MEYLMFKTDRIGEEYKRLDPRCQGVLLAVSQWQFEKWGIPVTITCIIRTSDENAAIGGLIQSAHVLVPGQLYARAWDMRNTDLTTDQRRERRDYILYHWNHGAQMFHARDHDSGAGDHTHVNLNQGYKL
jgi:hypothetical protein